MEVYAAMVDRMAVFSDSESVSVEMRRRNAGSL
jgi:hypothetical protein